MTTKAHPQHEPHGGAYSVRLMPLPLDQLEVASLPIRIRIIYSACQELPPPSVASQSSSLVSSHAVSPTVWRGLLLNVPDLPPDFVVGCDQYADSTSKTHVVVVSLLKAVAPVLVLAGLCFKGNVGTIVRSAVQANVFQSIIIIDPPSGSSVPLISEKDVSYYSMNNAPLIDIQRFRSVGDFLAFDEAQSLRRSFVATALTSDAIDVYSSEAVTLLANPSCYILLGTEAKGLPEELLTLSRAVKIPSLSSSINVSCAFSTVLTVMLMAQRLLSGDI